MVRTGNEDEFKRDICKGANEYIKNSDYYKLLQLSQGG